MLDIVQINEKKLTLNSRYRKFDAVATNLVQNGVANRFSPFGTVDVEYLGNIYFILPKVVGTAYVEIYGLNSDGIEQRLSKFKLSTIEETQIEIKGIVFTSVKTNGFNFNVQDASFNYPSALFNGYEIS